MRRSWIAVLLVACHAGAQSITIQDASFDVRSLSAGAWSNTITPWQETGGPGSSNGFVEYISGFSADGYNHLGMALNHNVWQDLGVTYQANTRYTLTVAVGNRSGQTQSSNQSRYILADSAGTTYATGTYNASTVSVGTFADATPLVFETGSSQAAVGKTIRILLQAGGAGRSHFDKIRLTAAAMAPPTATTGAAGNVTDVSATLAGTVNANGANTAASFAYGLTTAYGGTVSATPSSISGSSSTAVSAALTGLAPGTTYHYRMVATSGVGTTYGTDRTFTTETPAYLSALSVSEGTLSPSFSPTVTAYAVQVPPATTGIRLTPETQSAGATIRVQGMVVASGTTSDSIVAPTGNTQVTIGVTAAGSNFSKTYVVTVIRPAESFVFTAANSVAVTVPGFDATGLTLTPSLGFAPATGTSLTVVNNTGPGFIRGEFSNLTQGQRVNLTYQGVIYPFVANYYGGTGNDLVLHWAYTRHYAWGSLTYSLYGNGTMNYSSVPIPIAQSGAIAGKTIVSLASGKKHRLALCADGTLAAWGWEYSGAVKLTPEAMNEYGALAGKRVVAISKGEEFSLVLCADGTVVAWGSNVNGQLGTGNTTSTLVPTAVSGGALAGRQVVAIAAGSAHSLALCSDGMLAAWGSNTSGELGDGTTTARSLPVAVNQSGVLAGRTVMAVSAGSGHSMVLCSDGRIANWGWGSYGGMGNGTTANSSVPVLVTNTGVLAAKTVTALAEANNYSLALCSDGTIAGWGYNGFGGLGNGTYTNTSVPVAVTASGVLAGKVPRTIGANYASFALCEDGTPASWGDNQRSQLGDGTSTSRNTPVVASMANLVAGDKLTGLGSGCTSEITMALAAVALSTNNELASLSLDGAVLDPVFASATTAYTARFAHDVAAVRVTPVTADPNATVTINGAPLATGATSADIPTVSGQVITIRVTAENGTARTYTLTLRGDASLAALNLDRGSLLPAFSPFVRSYSVALATSDASLRITPVTADPAAAVKVSGTPSGAGGVVVPLVYGDNPVSVAVTAGDGTELVYQLTVSRPGGVNYTYVSASGVAVTASQYVAAENVITLALGYAPTAGTTLMVVRNAGDDPITGRFTNLDHGQMIELAYNGITYPFVANYFGGTGNDLVLQWANTAAYGWGENNNGQLGNGGFYSYATAEAVDIPAALQGKTLLALATGGSHSLALFADGTLASWGANAQGQLGNGTTTDSAVPAEISRSGILAGRRVVAIAAGREHSIALCEDGTLAAWGGNSSGQLGNGALAPNSLPVAVKRTGVLSGKTVVALSAGRWHSLALCSDGTVAAWGLNSSGQLGIGTTTGNLVPVQVMFGGSLASKRVAEVGCGEVFSVARFTDGSVATWGGSGYYQLGDGTTTPRLVPTQIPQTGVFAGKSVTRISVGNEHSLALCSDGTLIGWGRSESGRLGNGSWVTVPVLVSTTGALSGKTITDFAAGYSHSLALCSDGTLAFWGVMTGVGGEISTPSAVPLAPMSGNKVTSLAKGGAGGHAILLAAAPTGTASTLASLSVEGGVLDSVFSASTTAYGVWVAAGVTTLRVVPNAADPNATVTVNGNRVPRGAASEPIAVAPGNTSISIRVTAQNGVSSTQYTLVVRNDSSLAGLSISAGSLEPAFSPSVKAYQVVVPASTAAIRVTAATGDPDATLTVNGAAASPGQPSEPVSLSAGANAIPVVVAGAGGSTESYALTVIRQTPINHVFVSATDSVVTGAGYNATGNTAQFALGFAPPVGTVLRVINNTGLDFIRGEFDNLAHGQRLDLTYNGITYPFVANYFGGTGNDLVLQWANVRVVGWGANGWNQLGASESTGSKLLPTPLAAPGVLAGKTVTALAGGRYHSLALCSDGTLAAWGHNSIGELGNGTHYTDEPVPVAVSSSALVGRKVVAIAAGETFSMALCADGTVTYWGHFFYNYTASFEGIVPTVLPLSGVLAGRKPVGIAVGAGCFFVRCADGTVVGYGNNDSGILGNNSTMDAVGISPNARGALAGKPVSLLAASGHCLATTATGGLVAWGANVSGQLGDGTTTAGLIPVAVNSAGVLAGKTPSQITVGTGFSLVNCTDGTLAAWGSNNYGELGRGTTGSSSLPVLVFRSGVLSGKTVSGIIAGSNHALATCTDGTLAAWGYNAAGQVGDNSTTNRNAPVLVSTSGLIAGERFVTVGAGIDHSLAITALPVPPRASTLAATEAMDMGAILNGSVNGQGNATSVSFEYGLTTAYGATVAATPATVTGSTATVVKATLGGLTSGTRYHYRVVANGPGGVVRGEDQTFDTTTLANLANLALEGAEVLPALDLSRSNYFATVSHGIAQARVTPTCSDAGATVTVNGTAVISGAASEPVALGVENTAISVVVTGSGGNSRTYTLTVTRLPETFVFDTSASIPVTAADFAATGDAPDIVLGHAPQPGAILTLVNNTGLEPIAGTFANLAQGEVIDLTYNGENYSFAANYCGGTGNDLVLHWAAIRLMAWGGGNYGQLGNGGTVGSWVPTPVEMSGVLAGRTIIGMEVHGIQSVAWCADGTLATWGARYNTSGGSYSVIGTTPVAVDRTGVLAGRTAVRVAVGQAHCMALCADGALVAWGNSLQGQLGNNDTSNTVNPPVLVDRSGVLAGKTVMHIAAGGEASFALCSDGTLAGWGSNIYGRLGNGDSSGVAKVPALVKRVGALAGKTVTRFSAGTYHSLALCSDGSLAAWGHNNYGQLGNNSTTDSVPVPVAVVQTGVLAGKTVTAIFAGYECSFCLCSDGTLAAWGNNGNGQLGNGGTTGSSVPVLVTRTGALAGKTISSFTGNPHCLALCTDGSVIGWGSNSSGQLGNNSTTSSTLPTVVATGSLGAAERFVALDNGGELSVALVASPSLPVASSLAVTGITDTGATLNGEVNANGTASTVSFEYGTNPSYLTTVAATPGSFADTGATPVSADLTGLLPETTYHYRLVATNGTMTTRTEDRTFTTSGEALLGALSLDGGPLMPAFSPHRFDYDVTVPFATGSATLTAAASMPGVSVTVNGAPVASAGPVALAAGGNAIRIRVAPPGDSFANIYTVNVTRLPQAVRFETADQLGITASAIAAGGNALAVELGFAPPAGTALTVVRNHGVGPILGQFTGLEQGRTVYLNYGGTIYPFVANYCGGSGNDLVLEWGNVRLVAWGYNANGQLGSETPATSAMPLAVRAADALAGRMPLGAVASDNNSLVLCADGGIAAWGYNYEGQLGNGTTRASALPVAVDASGVLAGKRVMAMPGMADLSTHVLCDDGTVASWGYNSNGQLGDGTTSNASVPVRVPPVGALAGKRVVQVASARSHTLALCSDGTVVAWGYNGYGQLGDGSLANAIVPVRVPPVGALGDKEVKAVAAGDNSSYALCSNGTVVAWGYNSSGELGDGTTNYRSLPAAVSRTGALAGKTVTALQAGGAHCLALCSDGTLVAWGGNGYGQLGDGTTTNRTTPVTVDRSGVLAGKTVVAMSVGDSFSVVLCADGSAAAWGRNNSGQLGNGTTTNRSVPVLVDVSGLPLGERLIGVDAGAAHVLARVAMPPPPTATTLAANGITDSGAVLNGLAGANCAVDPVSVSFEYGTSTAYGATVAASPATVAGAAPSPVSVQLTGMPPGTVFHFRVVVSGALGVTKGEDRVFVTTGMATLTGLSTDHGNLVPAFVPCVGTYDLTVVHDVATISITPATAHAGASVAVDGEPAATGTASAPIPLEVGANSITVTVRPPGGGAGLTYTLNVVRLPAVMALGSPADVPLSVDRFAPAGTNAEVGLGYAPVPGADLMLVRNNGDVPIRGEFANLAHNQRIELTHAGVRYAFVADYRGGTGNDLVLRWADSRLAGWGANSYGQLGNGTTVSAVRPGFATMPDAFANKTVREVSPGGFHTLVLFTDGSLAAFGNNGSGQLGNGTSSTSATPVMISQYGVLAGKRVVGIAAGSNHSLALCSDGTLAGWGYNISGQIGNGSTTNSLVPAAVDRGGALAGKTVTAVVASGDSSMALCADGTVTAWGYNGYGRLGDGTQTSRYTPVAVDRSGVLAGRKVVSIACGSSHCLALCDDGSLAAWGNNGSGNLGDGSTTNRSVPVLVNMSGLLAGKTVTAIAVGGNSNMALCADGSLAAWGSNSNGQLGNNSTTNSSLPVRVEPSGALAGKSVTAIACGLNGNSYAMTADGGIAAWGANSEGQLGNGTTTASLVPVAVDVASLVPGGRVTAIGGGGSFVHAVVAIPPAPANFTTATTLAASDITDAAASLNGTVNAADGTVTVGFEYGRTETYGSFAAATPTPVSGASDTPVSARLENLAVASSYHFRLVATGPSGVVRGTDQIFTTGDAATLVALGLSAGTLDPAFDPGIPDYATAVSNETRTVTLTPRASHATAAIRVNGDIHVSGTPTAPLALSQGDNLIPIAVDAGDGVNSAIYRLSVVRLPAEFVFGSGTDIPLETGALAPGGLPVTIKLNFAPVPGARLILVNQTGSGPIRGEFSNLPDGGRVYLTYGGKSYDFIANYHGGDGNDLELVWGATRMVGWGSAMNGATFGSPQPAPLSDEGALAGRMVLAMSAAGSHGVACCLDGSVVTWGSNDYGQLGTGLSGSGAVPVEVDRTGVLAGKRVIAVSTGGTHDLALCSDGTLVAWGAIGPDWVWLPRFFSSGVPVEVNQTGVLAGKTPVMIAAGGNHAVVVCGDGTVASWGMGGLLGDGGSGDATKPVLVDRSGVLAGRTLVALSAGGKHTLALCADGTLVAWGMNDSGQLGNGTTTAAAAPVAVDLTAVPAGSKVVAISAGGSHSLALCSDGTLLAWGGNESGQIGNLGTTDQTTPVAVYCYGELDGRRVAAISAGGSHSLALAEDGAILAWGENYYGQLGCGDTVDYPVPTPVAAGVIGSGDRPITIAAGYYSSVALLATSPSPVALTLAADGIGDTSATLRGHVGGNGSNVTVAFEYGLTSEYGKRIAAVPAQVPPSGESPVEAGIGDLEPGRIYHFRVVATRPEGMVRGQDMTFTTTLQSTLAELLLDHGTLSPAFASHESEFAATVEPGVDFVALTPVASAAGAGIRVGGTVVSSGSAHAIPLVVGENRIEIEVTDPGGGSARVYRLAVTRPPAAFRFDDPETVALATVGFDASGLTASFVLGHAPVPGNRLTVIRCAGFQPILGRFANLSQGQLVTLSYQGVDYAYVADYFGGTGNDLVLHWANTRLLSCGSNASGLLGLGKDDTTRRTIPTPVLDSGILDGRIVTDAKCGYGHTVLLCSDGTVVTFGYNSNGELGRPTGTIGVPASVNAASVLAGRKVVMIATGSNHTLALCEDGTLVGWGINTALQLGNIGATSASVPVLVPMTGALAAKRITAIAAGGSHSLALCSDGTVAAWGASNDGQTGTGISGYLGTPTQVDCSGVLAGRKVAAIASGVSHSLAWCTDGTLAAWGNGDLGELGNGLSSDSAVPVRVDQTGVLAGGSVVAIACGDHNSMAMCSDGRIATWGLGASGALGNGGTANAPAPVAVDLTSSFAGAPSAGVSIGTGAAAWSHGGTLRVWGGNAGGQLGDGTQTNRPLPVAVSAANLEPEDRFAAVACGYQHAVLLVGQMPSPPRLTPLPADNLTAWSATLRGAVNARSNNVGLSFEYGLTPSYGGSTTALPGMASGKTDITLAAPITGLIPGRTYHYRLVASGPGGTTHSEDVTFFTAGHAPAFAGYAASTPWQTPATIALRKILTKASDPDGGAISITSAGPVSANGGAVVLLADSVRYTPPDGFSGTDTFTIVLTDEGGASVTGTVTVQVGSAPNVGTPGANANPPKLATLPGGKMGLSFQGIPGRSYIIQRSIGGLDDWQTLATVTADATGKISFTDENPPPGSAFYRLGSP
ncbi:MAG: cadherin-like beta sandwich domain-containing protein [Verrucomicrobia bacterium]|nr:cadherin-like beta sandwich domain-containing protein [Verrucomicrobiota bacterium]